jgi:hypothetical protein
MRQYGSIEVILNYPAESVDVKRNHSLVIGPRHAERKGRVRIVMSNLNADRAGRNIHISSDRWRPAFPRSHKME